MTAADTVRDAMDSMRHTMDAISKAFVGRTVKVLSDHNGQPYGRSKKSWKGETAIVKHVLIDTTVWEVLLTLSGHEYECMIPADEVEFV